jgi:ABC-type multidrug transport system ATPase subunit
MAEKTVIETTGLTRRFGAVTAVADLNLRVPAGSVYGFLGPNGAGKTTTIRMLLGLIRPHAGEVRLFGQPLAVTGRQVLARLGALVETPSIYPHLTGCENLELTRRLLRVPTIRVKRALQIVGLETVAERRAGDYSQGMLQRLGLALALLGDVQLLILDEPTNGLDPAGIREVRDLVRRLAGEFGMTVFLSSHLLSEVEQVATHLGIVNQGRLLFQGQPNELKGRLNGHVTLGAEPRELAERVLTDCGWRLLTSDNGFLKVAAGSAADAAKLNAELNRAGVQVSHLYLDQPSLEELFLTLTQGA